MRGLRSSSSVLLAMLLVCAAGAQAQQSGRTPRIAFISAASASAISDRTEAFRAGLKELGYIEGRNLRVEYRWTDGDLNRLSNVVAEIIRLKVDVIVSAGPAVTRRFKNAGVAIPVVMAFDHDPVGSGFVASLARPGGNITGFSTLAPQTSGKQVELLREILPKLARVAVLSDGTVPGNAQALQEVERAGQMFSVEFQHLDVRASRDLAAVFQAAVDGRAEALLLLMSPLATSQRAQIVQLATQARLPTMYYGAEFVEEGGLVTYSASIPDLFRRSAAYVDKILKGAKPATLPVEQPTKFELVINLKAANEIGLAVPPGLLTRADRVIR